MTLHLILFLLKRSEAVCCAGSDIKQLQYNILWSALQKLNKSISKGKVTLFRVFWWAGGIKDIDGFKFLKFYNHYTSHSSQFCVHTPVPLCSRLFAWHDFFFFFFSSSFLKRSHLLQPHFSQLYFHSYLLCIYLCVFSFHRCYCCISFISLMCFTCHLNASVFIFYFLGGIFM